MAVEAALVAREKERNAAAAGSRSIQQQQEDQHGFSPLEAGLLRGNVFLCGRKTARRRRRRMDRVELPVEGRLERRIGNRVKRSPRHWRMVGRGGEGSRMGERAKGGRRRRMHFLQDNERIELKEAPPGMRKYWCTIVRENYKMLLGKPGKGGISADRRKEVIARLGQVLGTRGGGGGGREGGGGGGGGRVERKLSLPISILSPGKPTLTKGPPSDPLLVTKSSIARRFWADPRRIHHSVDGIHQNPRRIHYDLRRPDHNLGKIHHNHHPLYHEPQEEKHPQFQLGQEDAAAMMASEIVAELKRRDHFVGQQKTEPEGSQVLWGSSFKSGGRRIWQEPDSEENYISQKVDP